MLKQGLELKQTQKLSPLQIQTIKLIELPIQELEQRVRKELEENPVLDEDMPKEKEDEGEAPREVSLSEYKEDDAIPSYRLRTDNYSKDERPQYNTFSVKESFTQSLQEQLGYRQLTEHQYAVASFLIGSLDDDGYLRRGLGNIVDDLSFRANIETTEEELLEMLKVIQEFEPAGVGARDLRECLLIQIRNFKKTPDVEIAVKILKNHLHEFTSKHYQKIMTRMNITEDQLRGAISKILKLNPSPGGQIDDSYADQAQQIVPDFILEYQDGELKLSMPRFSIPELRVNRKYAELLMDAANKKLKKLIKKQ
jgi:RNA polymerase sigma-54 factor